MGYDNKGDGIVLMEEQDTSLPGGWEASDYQVLAVAGINKALKVRLGTTIGEFLDDLHGVEA